MPAPHPENRPGFCCAMRRKFLLGIIWINPDVPTPAEEVDFIDWDTTCQGKPVLTIAYCPWCGKKPGAKTRTPEDIR